MRLKLFRRIVNFSICLLLINAANSLSYGEGLYSYQAVARQRLSGIVTDDGGSPLVGVTVAIKGTTIGTTTNTDGKYTIQVDRGQIIVFSSVGYQTKEIKYEGQDNLVVKLVATSTKLDEVIAVGYGTMKRSDITGAVTNVSLNNLNDRPITNASQALSGTASGVQITQNSGQPGKGGAQIRIRGVGTLTSAGQDPLILIDGIASNFYGLNPDDIESITVLKDAASAAIYGSRAANGVILITTKKGFKGKPLLHFDGYYGFQSPTRLMNLIANTTEHMELINEARANINLSPQFPQSEIDDYKNHKNGDPLLYPNTNWLKVIYGTPMPIQKYNLALSGGNKSTLYRLSLGYLDQKGMDGLTGIKRYNARLSDEIDVTSKFKVTALVSGYVDALKGPDDVMNVVTDWGSSPGIAVKGKNGKFGGPQITGEGNAGNPLAVLSATDRRVNSEQVVSKLSLQYKFLDNLILQTNGGLRFENSKSNVLNVPWQLWNFRTGEVALNSQRDNIQKYESNQRQTWLTSYTTLNYNKTFDDGAHYLGVLLGQSIETYSSEFFSGSVEGVFSPATPILSAGISDPIVLGSKQNWALLSYFGRINYNYRERYLLEFNIRRDGSSRFRPGNRWGTFPSISGGWIVSKETFFPREIIVSNLKLRGSWGKLGNQQIGSNYPYQSVYDVSQNYDFGGRVVDGAAQTSLANGDIEWESTATTNLGIDLGLFANKFLISFDLYNRLTDDILVQLPIPATLGWKSSPYQNIGKVRNRGWDLEMNYRNHFNDFSFNISANISNVQNKVVKYKGDVPSISGALIIEEGLPYQSIYGFRAVGIFQTKDQISTSATQDPSLTAPGDIKYEDYNNDGKIDANDRQVIGNTIPKYDFGLSFNISYKNLSLGILFQGVGRVDRYLSGRYVFPIPVNDRGYIPAKWKSRWTEENPSTKMPRMIIQGQYDWNYRTSTFWMQDGSFLRLKNINLAYSLPKKWVNGVRIQSAKIYFNAQNILTFTNYEGYDPETFPTETSVGYPVAKIISFGLNVDF